MLHLEGGKDIFVTVVGEYVRSVFGCSITALVNMSEPMKAVTPGKLIELVSFALIGIVFFPKIGNLANVYDSIGKGQITGLKIRHSKRTVVPSGSSLS